VHPLEANRYGAGLAGKAALPIIDGIAVDTTIAVTFILANA
jgi:hypothetical protein